MGLEPRSPVARAVQPNRDSHGPRRAGGAAPVAVGLGALGANAVGARFAGGDGDAIVGVALQAVHGQRFTLRAREGVDALLDSLGTLPQPSRRHAPSLPTPPLPR